MLTGTYFMIIAAHIHYIDELLIKGSKEFAALLLNLLITGGPTWLICTILARYFVYSNFIRLCVILPFHIIIPYLFFYLVIENVYNEFEEFGEPFQKSSYLDDSLGIFLIYVLLLLIPLYILKLWRIKKLCIGAIQQNKTE